MSEANDKILQVLIDNNLASINFVTIDFNWLSTATNLSKEDLNEALDKMERERIIDQLVVGNYSTFKLRIVNPM